MYRSLEAGAEGPLTFPSRKLGWAFVAIFIIGFLVGGLVVWDFSTDNQLPTFLKKTSDPINMAARIHSKYVADYQLNPDQMTKIDPLTLDMTQKLFQLRNQFASDVLTTMDDYHAKASVYMTPAQQALYDKANADRKQKMSAMLFLNPGSPSPVQK
jgi:hypothetical protein